MVPLFLHKFLKFLTLAVPNFLHIHRSILLRDAAKGTRHNARTVQDELTHPIELKEMAEELLHIGLTVRWGDGNGAQEWAFDHKLPENIDTQVSITGCGTSFLMV